MRVLVMCCALAGCGRFGFDAHDATVGDGSRDANPLDPSLVVAVEFEPQSFLVDTAGGHAVTCASCPMSQASGRVGAGAAAFADNNCVAVADAADLHAPTVTIAAFVNATSPMGSTVLSRPEDGATTGDNTYEIFWPTDTNLEVTAMGMSVVSSSVLPGWHHIAGVINGDRLDLYLDGLLNGSTNGVPPLLYGPDPLRVGCDYDISLECCTLVGAIDDVRVYTRALAPAEIAALATAM